MAWISKVDTYLSMDDRIHNAQLVANHFIATGWTPNAISALCGNMSHESTMNPQLYEMGYGHSPNRGYGLVQWTPATKLWNWANGKGLDWSDGDVQLSRIDYEQEVGIQWIKRSDYPLTFNEFTKSNRSIDYLTWAFARNYERPAEWALQESIGARIAFANRCLEELDWSGHGVVIDPDPDPSDPSDPNNPPDGNTNNNKDKALIHMFLANTLRGWG